MSEKIIPLKMNLPKFLAGQDPASPDAAQYLDTIEDWRCQCALRGDGQFLAQCALICEGNGDQHSVTGAMVHVFNMKDHSSRLFTIDAKDGVIDWAALREIIQGHTQAPRGVGPHWENANGVSEFEIHCPSMFTQRVAEALVSQMTSYTIQERRAFLDDVAKQYASSDAPNEQERMYDAIIGAIHNLPRESKLDTNAAYQAAIFATDPAQKADIMLRSISDVHYCEIREQWTGEYAKLQAQGYSPQQAGALAMLKTLAINMDHYTRNHEFEPENTITTNDYAECAFISVEATEMAQAAHCSNYDIGKARNPGLAVNIEVFGLNSPTNSYLMYAASVYAKGFKPENKAMAIAMFRAAMDVAPGGTPNEKIQYVIEHTKNAVQRATGEVPPTFEAFNAHVSQVRNDTKDWTTYMALHSGNLTPAAAAQLQETFVEKMFEVGATRSINQHTGLAIAMYKAAREVSCSPEMQNNLNIQYHLAGISSGTIRELSNHGMNAEQMHEALDDHDDIGDDTVGDDAI